jgi:hypothetical protein
MIKKMGEGVYLCGVITAALTLGFLGLAIIACALAMRYLSS